MINRKALKKNVRRKAEPQGIQFKWLFRQMRRMTVVIMAAGLFCGAGYYLSHTVNQLLQKPIVIVELKGELYYLTEDEVKNLISSEIEKGFINENLVAIRKNVQAHPWVDRVDLRRQWPDKLLVTVTEQRPIARWGQQGFVNYRGELIEVEPHPLLQDMPELRGERHHAYNLMRQYQLLSQLLEKYRLRIRQLERNQLGLWTLELNNDWQIIAGRTQVVKKVQQFMQLIEHKKIDQQDDIAVIDMRYENGLAIQWLKGQGYAAASNRQNK